MQLTSLILASCVLLTQDQGAAGWFDVSVSGPFYVPIGGSASLDCHFDVGLEILHKVEWLREGRKFFQFVRLRKPPYRTFHMTGGFVSVKESNESHVVIKNLTLNASGYFNCEVSTDTPIYTKSSEFHPMTVIEGQKEAPKISFGKPVYTVGEWIQVNCSSSPRSKPPPDLTWLVNGVEVAPTEVRVHKGRTAELILKVEEEHAAGLQLTCMATLPGSQNAGQNKTKTITVDVVGGLPTRQETTQQIASSGPRMGCNSARSVSFIKFSGGIQFLFVLLLLV